MFVYILCYILITFAALAVLCKMILHIGSLMATCPDTGARAKTAAITIATGFAAIGAGGLILISAAMPIYPMAAPAVFLGALGFASLCLGLGFTHAVGTLRAVILPAPPKAKRAPAENPASPWPREDPTIPAI